MWLQALSEEPGVCPEATSNVFSLLTFAWVGPLMRLGYKCAAQAAPVRLCDSFVSQSELSGLSTCVAHTLQTGMPLGVR